MANDVAKHVDKNDGDLFYGHTINSHILHQVDKILCGLNFAVFTVIYKIKFTQIRILL